MDQPQKIIQKALLERDGKILLLKRAIDQDYYGGMWDLPGGHLEQGEEAITSLVREVEEETALLIDGCQPKFVTHNQYNGYKLIYYQCRVSRGDEAVKTDHENSAFQWADNDNILDLDLAPNTREFLEKYLASSPKE